MRNTQTQKKEPCERLLKLIGDYWTLNIIEALGKSERRFCELERMLPSINPVTLTSRLKDMEQLDLVTRTREDKIAIVYKLSDEGLKLVPIAANIRKFAENFHAK